MIPPLAIADSAAFSAGQQLENRRIGELLRYRRSLIRDSALPRKTQVLLIKEIETIMRGIEQAGS